MAWPGLQFCRSSICSFSVCDTQQQILCTQNIDISQHICLLSVDCCCCHSAAAAHLLVVPNWLLVLNTAVGTLNFRSCPGVRTIARYGVLMGLWWRHWRRVSCYTLYEQTQQRDVRSPPPCKLPWRRRHQSPPKPCALAPDCTDIILFDNLTSCRLA